MASMNLVVIVFIGVFVQSFYTSYGAIVNTALSYPVKPVKNDLFGMNFNWWIRSDIYKNIQWPSTAENANLPNNNTYLLQLFKATQVRVMRYPGGTTGTFWNVSSGAFVNINSEVCRTMANSSVYTVKCSSYTAANTSNLAYFPPGYLSLQNFGESMHNAGMPWIYVANLYTVEPQITIDALHQVCSPGNVACPTLLELGNEYYLTQFFPTGLLSNATIYADRATIIYNEVSQYFNDSVSALSSFSGYVGSQPTNTQVQWNNALNGKKSIAYDHLTIHTYSLKTTNFRANLPWAWYTLMLAYPESVVRATANQAVVRVPNVELWLTEFNYGTAEDGGDSNNDAANTFSKNQRWQPSHGLNVAGYYISMLQYPSVFTKAFLFESMRDNFLSSYLVNASGSYAYATGQIFSHLSYISKTHDTSAYLRFNNADLIRGVTWYNNFNGNMSALQGALYYGDENTKLTYLIMNRVNYTIEVELSETEGYTPTVKHEYFGNVTISEPAYPIDIDAEPSFPWAGPIPVTTTPLSPSSGVYVATIAPFTLQILHFTATEK